jgi:hypothetical protein
MSDALRVLAVLLLSALPPLARGADWLMPLSTVNEPLIAGREVQLDARGRLLPWPFADDSGRSYDAHVRAQWALLQDLLQRQRMPYFHCCFQIDPVSGEPSADHNWVNSTAYLRGMMIGFVERLYPYTGDASMLGDVEAFVDYELAHGLTPADYKWAGVPYPSADPGAADYHGWSARGSDYIEPHVVGEDGYAYVRLYEMTGQEKYLTAAIHFADQLVKNYQPGDELHSPWPVRCLARDGRVEGAGMGPYSANVLGPISLFDELVRIGRGDVPAYRRTRAAAWQWLQQYPLRNNLWVGYFEDVAPSYANMNSVIPLELARYLLWHPEFDGQWRAHARALIDWVRENARWPKYRVHGALVTTEQGNGSNFCCNKPNQCCDSHTARLAAVEALYYARTGERRMREEARRSLNWATYFQGLPGQAHAPFGNQWWFNDEFTDGPRRMMEALWAVPEWAPADASHLLGSSSALTHVEYGRGSVRYATFDADARDVLRLDFRPTSVRAGGRALRAVCGSPGAGWCYDAATGVLRIDHRGAREVEVRGEGGHVPSLTLTFDNPHLPAGTPLQGEYPAALIEWTAGSWQSSAPAGAFGTFHVAAAGGAGRAAFRFISPSVLAGIDAYNPGTAAATLRLRCAGGPDYQATLPARRVQRLVTGWQHSCSEVSVEFDGPLPVHLDNLAYIPAGAAFAADAKRCGEIDSGPHSRHEEKICG